MNRDATSRLLAFALAAAALAILTYGLANPEAASARRSTPVATSVAAFALAYGIAGGPNVLRIARAMLKKTSLAYLSYRVQLVSILAYALVTVGLYFVAGRPLLRILLPELSNLQGQGVPGNLVLVLVVGFSVWPIFWRSWEVTSVGVRTEQWEGTFESIIALPGGVRALPFGYLYSRLLFTLVFQLAILGALAVALPEGALALRTAGGLMDFVAVMLVSILCMWGMGLLFGGLAILYKQVGPIDLVVRSLFLFLSGVFVPLGILPGWAQTLAKFLPMTYAFELLRAVAVEGVPIAERAWPLLALLTFTTFFVVAGNLVYRRLVETARRQGAIQGY